MKKLFLAALLMGAVAASAMDEDGWATEFESLSAFDSQVPKYGGRPGYVKPIIDNLGNVLNSNWYVSANVPQSFTFEAGLPIALIPIGNDDKTYSEGDKEVPTIFGDHGNPEVSSDTIYGNKTLNGLGLFTYPYIQLGAGFYHFRGVVRFMYLPAISELRKFSLFGIGFQYSFGHFFQYMMPKGLQPLDISIVYGYNSSSIGYQPEDFEGELDLDVSTHNFSVVIGYKPVSFFEVMMSLGYQSAEMMSYGQIYQTQANSIIRTNEINPDITVKGNNGFRFGLSIALQISSFHPVVGYDYAGKSSFTTNALYFRSQIGTDKTPDEIAKEKGYDRNAKQEEPAAAPVAEPATQEAAPADEPVEEAPAAPAVEEPASEPVVPAEEAAAEPAAEPEAE